MALPAALNVNVRTDGGDGNGAAFVKGGSGTDYSKQAAAQFSGTDLASVSSLVVSSASHNFVSTDVDNLIQITTATGSGWTAGFYRIVSVASNHATLDRSPGTVGTSGTWAVGGALLTISKALGMVVAGNTINLKSGTYTQTATLTLPSVNNCVIQGYQTTYGDLYPTNTRPLITTATSSTNLFTAVANFGDWQFNNLSLSNTASTRAAGIIASTGGESNSVTCFNCLFTGFTSAVKGNFSGDYYFALVHMLGCEMASCTGTGAIWNDGLVVLDSCYIHGSTSAGLYFDQSKGPDGPFYVLNTVFSGNQDAINFAPTSVNNMLICRGCYFYNQSRDAIRMTTNVAWQVELITNIFDSNTGDCLNITGTPTYVSFFGLTNFLYNNGGTYNLPGTGSSLNDVTLTGSPAVSAGTNFALNNTAGAGALVRAAGFPGAPTSAGTGYADGGPFQSQGSSGSTGGLLVHPAMTGGISG